MRWRCLTAVVVVLIASVTSIYAAPAAASIASNRGPDGQISLRRSKGYVGNDVYNISAKKQTKRSTAEPATGRTFFIRAQNDDNVPDSLQVRGCKSEPKFKVTYLAGVTGSTRITSAVTNGIYTLRDVDPGTKKMLRLKVAIKPTAEIGDVWTCKIALTSKSHPSKKDVVKASLETIEAGPFDGTITPEIRSGKAKSEVIGPDGGSLTAGGIALTIPPAALLDEIKITVTPLGGIDGTPLDEGFIGGADLAPKGLRFLKQATLSLRLPAAVDPADVLGFGYQEEGKSFHLSPHGTGGGTIDLPVWHFSGTGAASGDATAVEEITSTPLQDEAALQLEQEIEAHTFAFNQAVANGEPEGPARERLNAALDSAVAQYYETVVKPLLLDANGGNYGKFSFAFIHFMEIVAMELGGFAGQPAGPRTLAAIDEGRGLATEAATDLIERLLEQCETGDLVRILRVLEDMVALDLGGFLDIGDENALLDACASLEIDVIQFPIVAALSHPNTLEGQVTFRAHGTVRTDHPITLKLDGAAAAVDGDGQFTEMVTPSVSPVNVSIVARVSLGPGVKIVKRETVTGPARKRIKLETFNAPPFAPGETVDVTVRVAGDGMEGAAVGLALTGNGSLSATSVTTDAQGEATFTYTAPPSECPDASITATFSGTSDEIAINCEMADLAVDVVSPASAPEGDIVFTVIVTNEGPSAVTYTLDLVQENSELQCDGGEGSTSEPALAAGQTRSQTYTVTCVIEGDDGDGEVSVEATVTGPSDPDPGNNQDISTTIVS